MQNNDFVFYEIIKKNIFFSTLKKDKFINNIYLLLIKSKWYTFNLTTRRRMNMSDNLNIPKYILIILNNKIYLILSIAIFTLKLLINKYL